MGVVPLQAVPADPDSAKAKILVVDDDEANLIAARAILSELGYPIVTARSGDEALRHLLHDDFAVILLDVRMPGIDGYETAKLIRSRPRTRNVPIIFLSGVDKDPSHLFKGYATGAVDYVFKPVEPIVLRSKVSVFTDLYQKTLEVRRQAEHEKRLMAENLEVRARQIEVAEALERSLAQQSLVIEALPIVLFVAPAGSPFEGRRFVGGNTEKLFGLPEAELSGSGGLDWLSCIHEDDRERVASVIGGAREQVAFEVEYRFRCADQGYRWVIERATLRAGRDGEPPEIFGILSDITERKRLEEQLTHAQKMEAIGQMSGAVAHDFNNMLSVIIGGLDRVLSSTELEPKPRQRLSLALQAAHSCADLTKRLLGFARRQSLEARELDIAAELDRLKGLFERVLGETIGLRLELESGLWPSYLDHSQFEAALVNLAVNARDAMPGGGSFAITARNVRLDAERAAGLDVAAGEYVELSLADSGVGMDAATQARALEPFFTTKGPGKGTGLGLSTIYGFLRQSGGSVSIDSELGRGTTVRLYLPRSSLRGAKGAAERNSAARRNFDGLRVLVVEDNASVLDVAVSMLEALGCEVVTAPSADAAARMGDRTDGISVLFTDCVMPGELDGPKLATLLMEKHEQLAVLFTSGYRGAGDALPSGRTAFLAKPYTLEQLSAALAEALGAG